MSRDDRKLLDVLKQELRFLEEDGYNRVAAHYWKPISLFQNSLACPNVDDPNRTVPCSDCVFQELIPPQYRDENVPCHFIPLNLDGETIHSMERQYGQEEVQEAVAVWLRTMIQRLEKEQPGGMN